MSENQIAQYQSLSKLTSDDRTVVLMLINGINTLRDQASRTMIDIGLKLNELESHVPDNFLEIVTTHCGFSSRNVRKLQTAAANYRLHFENLSAPEFKKFREFPIAKLALLGQDTDPEIIEELKNLAINGTLSNSTIDKVLDSIKENRVNAEKLSDYERENIESESRIIELERQLKEVESETAQLRVNSRNASDRVLELEKENKLIQSDLIDETKKPPRIVEIEVTKEVLPKRYKTLEDAVNSIEDEITEKSSEKERILAEIQHESKRLNDIRSEFEAKKVSLESVEKIVADIDIIIAKYPSALITQISASAPESKAILQGLRKKLSALASQLAT
ncbi:hypothetical protein ICN48_06475 [Polynucleobacter sp. JS-Safj-400b-B2]|uniref:hypothetical protein n=1 Tax=Polynucleobacter sp. JS-Safj-400b-B2 TaxID=2576921 RepID=UPI001C0B2D68|nr:hypothetical protein [Polynucleobacter sp. JS-Safj-400b-B2]MBU3625878.1 hypothetical protein [Polynucleobacter sp. JS-Safj-400b-B2]